MILVVKPEQMIKVLVTQNARPNGSRDRDRENKKSGVATLVMILKACDPGFI